MNPHQKNCIKYVRIFFFFSFTLTILIFKDSTLHAKDPRFQNNQDGTITDKKTGLMWAKSDSWNVNKKCLNWESAVLFVKTLKTGGHSDWRMPTLDELGKFPEGIVERGKTHNIGAEYKNWKFEYTLHLDPIFEDGAAYWVWSSNTDGLERAGALDLRTGHTLNLEKKRCFVLGVRGVRKP